MKFRKTKKKKKKNIINKEDILNRILINDHDETMDAETLSEIMAFGRKVGQQAQKVDAALYPEDIILLYLDSCQANTPESAVKIPGKYDTRIYTLWTENFIMDAGEKVYLTDEGRIIVRVLKAKVAGDKNWRRLLLRSNG